MMPTVIDDDRAAAEAIHRRTLTGYVSLPNYRNYWKQAGYVEEMDAIEAALAAGEPERLPSLVGDTWLHDVSLGGSAGEVREGFEAWAELGVLPIAFDVIDVGRPGQGRPGAVRRLPLTGGRSAAAATLCETAQDRMARGAGGCGEASAGPARQRSWAAPSSSRPSPG